jgi:hypothetical protein
VAEPGACGWWRASAGAPRVEVRVLGDLGDFSLAVIEEVGRRREDWWREVVRRGGGGGTAAAVGGQRVVVKAGGGGAVQGRRGGSGPVRWAERTGVVRKDGRSQVARKEKTVGVARHTIGGPYFISIFVATTRRRYFL